MHFESLRIRMTPRAKFEDQPCILLYFLLLRFLNMTFIWMITGGAGAPNLCAPPSPEPTIHVPAIQRCSNYYGVQNRVTL